MGDLLTSWKKPVEETPLRTAVRFPVRLALSLRAADHDYQAMTDDISANGLLFTGEHLPMVDSVIEFTINMPSAVMGTDSDVEVHCLGRVVRHTRLGNCEQAAAVIDEYYLKA